ncbi:MAG: NAD-dependent epimerase/dehydratase family protein [Steroidobacteraceae bacterium]|nr:NAD-dependent epimerase/dehydratase family protein [Steroidobacteraceae bacterium]
MNDDRRAARSGARPPRIRSGELPRVLVTGGAGFVGVNVAKRLLDDAVCVRVLDSLARPGSEHNIHWLGAHYAGQFDFVRGDLRDPEVVREAIAGVEHVVHLGAQVSATASLSDPLDDFDTNVRGTLNVLEAVRLAPRPPSLVHASTSEVYGPLLDLEVRAAARRYEPVNARVRARGIPETRPLDGHGPLGCSKVAAEQYVRDYARSYGLRTTVLRIGCTYGPHECGDVDHGGVAPLVRSVLAGRPVAIRGDGLQVRDFLYVDDLVEALEQARRHADVLRGRAFNVGGGVDNALGVLDLLDHVARLTGRCPEPVFGRARAGGRRYYVTDFAAFGAATGWQPRTRVADGLERLHEWLESEEPGLGWRDPRIAGLPGHARAQ